MQVQWLGRQPYDGIEARIAEKEADKAAINKRYADQKARYLELRGSSTPAPASAQAPAANK